MKGQSNAYLFITHYHLPEGKIMTILNWIRVTCTLYSHISSRAQYHLYFSITPLMGPEQPKKLMIWGKLLVPGTEPMMANAQEPHICSSQAVCSKCYAFRSKPVSFPLGTFISLSQYLSKTTHRQILLDPYHYSIYVPGLGVGCVLYFCIYSQYFCPSYLNCVRMY